MKPIVIGSRGSALALAQTRLIQGELQRAWPDRSFELRIIKTQGDRLSENAFTGSPLGKGLFTAELEEALRRGEIDLAVHSLKDLPTTPAGGLILGAIPRRVDARDVLITKTGASLEQLPAGAILATGSPRRSAQLKHMRPDIVTAPIRGNIDTRLRKLRESTEWAGLVLAAAGLERLGPGMQGLTVTPLPFSIMLPAPGQGALALQMRAGDEAVHKISATVHDAATAAQVEAERAFLAGLGGGCQQPIAAYAEIRPGARLELRAIAWLHDEPTPREGLKIMAVGEALLLGQKLAEEISQ